MIAKKITTIILFFLKSSFSADLYKSITTAIMAYIALFGKILNTIGYSQIKKNGNLLIFEVNPITVNEKNITKYQLK